MNNISKLSRKFGLLFKLLMVLYPVTVILMWCGMINIPPDYFAFSRLPISVDFGQLSAGLRLKACMLQMIPTMFVTLSLYYLVQLFKLYERGVIFGRENTVLIKSIGYTLIYQALAFFLSQPLLSLLLTMDAAPGQHVLVISIGSVEFSNLIIGGIVILISSIMVEGQKLEEEKALTI